MGWLITLGVFFLLAILPLGVSVIYNAYGPLVRIIAGPVKILAYPRPRKPKKAEKKKPRPEKKQPEQKQPAPPAAEKAEPVKAPPAEKIPEPHPPRKSVAPELEQKPSGGSWTDFLPLVKTGLHFLGDFRRKLRVKRLDLKLIMAGGDPGNLALNYGRAWAAVGNLMPQLERWFVIGKRNVEVECDFTGTETKVDARLDISITLGRLVALTVSYGLRVLKEYLSIQKKRKGGAAT